MSGEAPNARIVSEVPEPGGCVLVADDDRAAREQLAALLRAEGHTVEMCEDGQEVLARVALGGIDLVLLDVMMPRLSGTETCRLLKSMAAGTFLPVILVTARNDPPSRVEGLRIGADDYVGKPFDPDELSARVAAMLRIRRLVGTISDDRERLIRRSVYDDLTGLPNRRMFESRLLEERKRAERHHEPFACILVGINTTPASRDPSAQLDRLIVRGAMAVKRSVREGDVVARCGEAVIGAILTHTHFIGAISASERIFRDVASTVGEGDEAVSMGAAVFPSRDARTADSLLAATEAALEEAQRQGGGYVCILQQRKYLYSPNGPRSEGRGLGRRGLSSDSPPPPSVRRISDVGLPGSNVVRLTPRPSEVAPLQSEPPPPSTRRFHTEPPPTRRFQSEPPPPLPSEPKSRDPGDRSRS